MNHTPDLKKSVKQKYAEAGFEAIEVEPTRVYRAQDAREFLESSGLDVDAIVADVGGKFMSAFIRARKVL